MTPPGELLCNFQKKFVSLMIEWLTSFCLSPYNQKFKKYLRHPPVPENQTLPYSYSPIRSLDTPAVKDQERIIKKKLSNIMKKSMHQ